jgi:hypothetical protein
VAIEILPTEELKKMDSNSFLIHHLSILLTLKLLLILILFVPLNSVMKVNSVTMVTTICFECYNKTQLSAMLLKLYISYGQFVYVRSKAAVSGVQVY